MSYANRKFGHCHVAWGIEGCCLWFLPFRKTIESPFFFVGGKVQTKWRIILRCLPEEDNVKIQLTRLKHGDNMPVWVNLRLAHLDAGKDHLILQKVRSFNVGEVEEEDYPKCEVHNYNIDIRLSLIVYNPNDRENVYACQDGYLRELSKDMKRLKGNLLHYQTEMMQIVINPLPGIFAARAIMNYRIKNPKHRYSNYIKERINLPESYAPSDLVNILEFLYSADIAPVLAHPRIGIYYLAEEFTVRPLIAYFKPEHIYLHSTTYLQEFKITWNIAGLTSRKESCLISPKIKGEIYHCVLKIFPDVNKTNGGNIGVNFEIYLATRRHVCIELSLKTESNTEKLMEEYHKTFEGQEIFGSANTITPENLQIIPTDGRATVELNVCLSETPEDSSVRESLAFCLPYCHQQNYRDLSRDMLNMYKFSGFNPSYPLDRQMHNLLRYRFFLENRSYSFVKNFLDKNSSSRGNRIFLFTKYDTLDQVVQFLFCGRFSKILEYKDVFYFYDMAAICQFDSLKNALLDELKKQLSPRNAKKISKFAKRYSIDWLEDYIYVSFRIS